MLVCPRPFKAQTLPNRKENGYSKSFFMAISDGLTSATSLVRHIRECTLQDFTFDGVGGAMSPHLPGALGHMPNLRTLSMMGVCLSARVLQNICKVEGLQSLSLEKCDIPSAVILDFVSTSLPLRQHFLYEGSQKTSSRPDVIPYYRPHAFRDIPLHVQGSHHRHFEEVRGLEYVIRVELIRSGQQHPTPESYNPISRN
jgi:hypothetical protein